MNMKQWVLGSVVGLMLAGPVVAGEEYYLVKIVNFDHKRDVMTMSAAEYKTLERDLKIEEKYFAKAVADAAKDWRADELNKKTAFPGGRLSPRAIFSAQEFPSQEKADAQLSRIQDQESKKTERQAKDARSKKTTKSKTEEMREAETARAIDLVKAKLNEYLAKAGVTVTDLTPAKEEGKDAKKDDVGKAKKADPVKAKDEQKKVK